MGRWWKPPPRHRYGYGPGQSADVVEVALMPLDAKKHQLVLVGTTSTASVLKLRPVALMVWFTSACQSVRYSRPPGRTVSV
jgi:hypothetical protein